MKEDIRKLIDVIFSKATDAEIVEEAIVFLQREDVETGYKVDVLAGLTSSFDYNYFVDAQKKWDEQEEA